MLENDTTTENSQIGPTHSCWVLTDGAAGNERQALALAQALNLPARNLIVPLRAPWSWLAPRLTWGGRLAMAPAQRQHLTPPWPDLVIGCGRAAALLTRMLPVWSDGHSRALQILDPRIDPQHWDLVISPAHDQLSGDNVLNPLGSLNPVDDAWLADGREAWPHLAELPFPRVGALLGGPRRGITLNADSAEPLAQSLLARHRRDGGSLLLMASRRTPHALFMQLRERLRDIPGISWSPASGGPNPYPGVLGWADRLVVTPDSVNMLSEACATGCPVHTLTDMPLPDKLARFHTALRQRGLLHDLDADAVTPEAPLRETAAIAGQVKRRLQLETSTRTSTLAV